MAASSKGQARRKQKVIETAMAQRVHSVPLLRTLRVPYWGKETINMFIRKSITLDIYYLLQVFISH